MQRKDGMTYAPAGMPAPVVKPGEFTFSCVSLDHGHIYGMANGLIEAGATLKYVYDPDPAKVQAFTKAYPQATAAQSERQVLDDPDTELIAGAAIPSERCALGLRAMEHGKDYFTDKAPLTTLDQLAAARAKVRETGRKYMVYYSERLHVEGAILAGQLVERGAIGKVLQVIGLGPHRLSAPQRPDWFFKKSRYGGILCDIGSHQIEQILHYTGAEDGVVRSSQIANYAHPDHPELDDFGDCQLQLDNGCSGYFRVDWFTPDGLSTWGDGRAMILGTEGFIEQRKYVDIATGSASGNHVLLVNGDGERRFDATGRVGYPFFGQFILDCIHRTERAMTQDHAFKAAELCVRAQLQAVKLA